MAELSFISWWRNRPRVRHVDVAAAHALVTGGAEFLDVRNLREYKQGHADGARNVALNTLGQRMRRLDRERPIVVICASGMRSRQAAGQLARAGFRNVYNVRGGSHAWFHKGLPWRQ